MAWLHALYAFFYQNTALTGLSNCFRMMAIVKILALFSANLCENLRDLCDIVYARGYLGILLLTFAVFILKVQKGGL